MAREASGKTTPVIVFNRKIVLYLYRVVKSGRTFVRRMIDSVNSKKYLHLNVKLNSCFRADLDWWLQLLHTWNGVSVIQGDWCTYNILELHTDRSGNSGFS